MEKEKVQKSVKVKLILLPILLIILVIGIVGVVLTMNNNKIENKITSDVKDYLQDNTKTNFDISEITNINITNTKMEQKDDKKQFSIYGTLMIKDNFNNLYSASFQGIYDIVSKDGKETYFSNQIKERTTIKYPNNLPINPIKEQETLQTMLNEFKNIEPINTNDLIGGGN